MRSILVIGGNSDMGYAAAKIFAKNNFDIHLVSRNIEQLNIKKAEIIKVKINVQVTENQETVIIREEMDSSEECFWLWEEGSCAAG